MKIVISLSDSQPEQTFVRHGGQFILPIRGRQF
jgi:hypothetical protein